MNLNHLKPNQIVDSLTVRSQRDHNHVLVIVPEYDILDSIQNLNINFENCYAMLVDSSIRRMLGVSYIGRKHYFNIKAALQDNDVRMRVIINPPKRLPKNMFVVLDGTYVSVLMRRVLELYSPSKALPLFLTYLGELYQEAKKLPGKTIVSVILDLDAQSQLMRLLTRLLTRKPSKEPELFTVFDKYLFVHYAGLFYPILYRDKGKVRIHRSNLGKVLVAYKRSKMVLQKSLKSDVVKTDVKKGKPVAVVDTSKVEEHLRKQGINDERIIKTVANRLQDYVEVEDITEKDLDEIVPKVIHWTIKGTDDAALDPKQTYHALKELDTFKVPVQLPTAETTQTPFEPRETLDIKETTGLYRHKQELDESHLKELVLKAFKTLEKGDYPIKVVKIKADLKDNRLDRVYEFTVTLENTTNGEQYGVKVQLPAVVNDRYIKLGGKTYILANQLFLKPLTKTSSTEVRLLTNYATVTEVLANVKFGFTDLEQIAKYLITRYPDSVEVIE